jgi:uncharacterized protein (UPF0548 family)
VILLRKPSDVRIRGFLEDQRSLSFSYPEVGASRDGATPGYTVNRYRGRLGEGLEAYDLAVRAIRHWKMYETGWTTLCWPDAPISEGTVIGVLGRHLGFRSLNACRIAYTIEEEGPSLRRYGFAVGTLPGHMERGEERFTVEWHAADDSVYYDLFAFSLPVHPLARAAPPLARMIQRRFARDSLQSMKAAVGGQANQ